MTASKGRRIRKVCVVTGTRAEAGLLAPVMTEVRAARGLSLQVVACGPHLAREFGRTIRFVEERFRVDARVAMSLPDDTGAGTAEALGKGIAGLARAFEPLAPDAVLVLGDRTETLAAALAAHHVGCVVGHLHGGETTTAGFDDPARHAITRFAHLHFAATADSARRLRRMGEEGWRIHKTGGPGLDVVRALDRRMPDVEVVRRKNRLPAGEPYLVVVHHPVTSHPETAAREMTAVLGAVRDSGLPAVVLYPNADAGGRRTIGVLEKARNDPRLRIVKALPHEDYLALLAYADALVGNSSSGIIEAPVLRTPSVQVGERQKGRERGNNVVDCRPVRKEILRAIRRARAPAFRRRVARGRSPYGDGRAAARIVRILKRARITPRLLQKRLAY